MWSTSDDSELEFTSPSKKGGGGGGRGKKGKKKNKSKSKNNVKSPGIGTGTIGEGTSRPTDDDKVDDVTMEDGEEDSESSEGSTDEDVGMGCGKLALGLDPDDIQGYDGVSAPVNGSQYLMSVMREKKSVPKVVVARNILKVGPEGVTYLDRFKNSVNTNDFASSMESSPFTPSQESRNDKLTEFSVLRSKIERWKDLIAKGAMQVKPHNLRLPDFGNRVVWLRFCFGIKLEELAEFRMRNKDCSVETILDQYFIDLSSLDLTKDVNSLNIESVADLEGGSVSQEAVGSGDGSVLSAATSKDGCKPLMSIMLLLPQKQLELLVFYLATWIEHYGFINKCIGEWLYALLACIEKPLEPSTMGDIRNICKSLITIRNNFCSKLMSTPDWTQSQEDNKMDVTGDDSSNSKSSRAHEFINSLNLFVYLIGDYFSQKDLVMELS